MNLRIKFTLFALVFLLFIAIFVSYVSYSVQKSSLTKQARSSRDTSFKVIVGLCQNIVEPKETEQILDSVIDTYKPAIVYVSFISELNKFFLTRDGDSSSFAGRAVPSNEYKTQVYRSVSGENICEYVSPVTVGASYRGTLVVGFSQDYADLEMNSTLSVLLSRSYLMSLIIIVFGVLGVNLIAMLALKKDKEYAVLKEEFISSVSHEFKSPLSVIGGYCDLLICAAAKSSSQGRFLKGLNIIKDSTIRLTKFADNVLDLAEMKAGNFKVKLEIVYLDDVVNEELKFFEGSAITLKKKLVFDVQKNLPPVNADVVKIKRVVSNLLDNAFKFTSAGGLVTVGIRTLFYCGRECVEVGIADTGVGIAREFQQKIFERFYQIKGGKYGKPEGVGTGLSVAYEIIKLHGGRIWVESGVGKGTVAKFVLPVLK